MNQSQMFDKLQNWIDQLIVSSQNDFQVSNAENPPFFIDPNRFMFLLSELYEKTNEKERLFTICQSWSHSLLKNINLEDTEWEQLNRKSKQYETNHFFYIPNMDFKKYQDYCHLLFMLYYELEKFIISVVPQHTQTDENQIEQDKNINSIIPQQTQTNENQIELEKFILSIIQQHEQTNEKQIEPEKIYTPLTIKERLIILQYMQDHIMKIKGFSMYEMRWKLFITKLLNINLVSLKKPLEKINDAMNNNKLTPPEANELYKSYEKITDLFKSVKLSELKAITENRTDLLRGISQNDNNI